MEELRAFFNGGKVNYKSNGDVKGFLRELKKVMEKYNLILTSSNDIVLTNRSGDITLANLGNIISKNTI